LTYSHTCTGSDLVLFVMANCDGDAGAITGVTYNGVSMTLIANQEVVFGQDLYLYGLINPATGANNVVVSWTSSGQCASASISWTGVDQTTAWSGTVTQNSFGNTIALPDITSETGDVVCGFVCRAVNSPDVRYTCDGASHTERLDSGGGGAFSLVIGSQPGAATVTDHDYTAAGATTQLAGYALNIEAAAAASGTILGGLVGSNSGLLG
jgi:hypothetical protein